MDTKKVEENIGLVRLVLKNFKTVSRIKGIEEEDLYQEGILGLMKAVETYNPKYGLAFSTYACLLISRSMKRSLKKHSKHSKHSISLDVEDFKKLMEVEDKSINFAYSVSIKEDTTKLLSILNDKEKEIITYVYGIGHNGDSIDLEKCSLIYGTSIERVERIIKNALKKLKREVNNELKEYIEA